ncbi:MAG: TPM domain-containing protein [Bacteroidales bacterium]|nr:TPM domain-containing protein [Bacteroidales bacterium]
MGDSARDFFSGEEKDDIKRAIEWAELDTSGEIRVHIEGACKGDPRDRAAEVFEKLGMHKTASRNGVLFYLAVRNRKFAILGDAGINRSVPEDFWDRIRDRMLIHFRENRFAEGLAEAIQKTGEQLKHHFPYKSNDVNELPDEVSFGSK